ncbi:trichohyalin-like [Pecten maximus]|uniref:trichohyalin-like n=1 Tax=Pecten maximus TaxID=6579 RepID=UPI00145816EB|nr:trichohyalin-like [Pecten maximus]
MKKEKKDRERQEREMGEKTGQEEEERNQTAGEKTGQEEEERKQTEEGDVNHRTEKEEVVKKRKETEAERKQKAERKRAKESRRKQRRRAEEEAEVERKKEEARKKGAEKGEERSKERDSAEEWKPTKAEKKEYIEELEEDRNESEELEDDDDDGQMEVQDVVERPAEGTRHRPKRECPMPDCDKVLENIPRHLRQFHNMTAVEAANQVSLQGYQRNGRTAPKLGCPLEGCSSSTTRLDLHLTRIHSFGKESDEFREAMKEARTPGVREVDKTSLGQALREYARHSRNRITGRRQSANTAAAHETGIRTMLPQGLSKATVLDLKGIGEDGGLIDTLLRSLKPKTVKIYLCSLGKFVEFLSASFNWQRHESRN